MSNCPVCGSAAEIVREMPAAFIREQLGLFYHDNIPHLDIVDYRLHRCKTCTLEYCDPMLPGSSNFYEWVIHQPNYYPPFRWEWGVCLDFFKSASTTKPSIFEVGCGNGDFLRFLKRHNKPAVGVDTSESAVRVAKVRELDAHAVTIDEYILQHPQQKAGFDYVVSFHCLEHVDDPLDFVKSMQSMLNTNGQLLISTPFSPMCYESMWFDPLNHPPHHMTRWNFDAYRALASQINMQVEFYFPQAESVLQRTLRALSFKLNGFQLFLSKKQVYLYVLRNPRLFLKEFKNQQLRATYSGNPAADVVLARFYKK
jgi:2-polyprenyl-3-methyl-5-hydroxy-6-metoxy-1,4-benzoquinol methylase